MEHIWRFATEALKNDEKVSLLVVVENIGSVPGKAGSKLVVAGDEQRGTVGGGISESRLVEMAREGAGPVEIVEFQHDGDGIESICAGSQKVAIISLTADHLPVIDQIVSTLGGHGFGELLISSDGIEFNHGRICARSYTERDGGWEYREVEGFTETLTIIGGGHVSLALCRVMSTLPFKLIVLDNRPGLEIMRNNEFAHEKEVISYGEVARHVPQGDRCYAVIMTQGHAFDERVLGQLARGKFAYLGMMGSKSKVEKIFDNLEKSGIPREALDAVYSPIGLPIGSHSPEEIAVSIAAQLISVKNR